MSLTTRGEVSRPVFRFSIVTVSCNNFGQAHFAIFMLEKKMINQTTLFDQLPVFWLHN